MIASASRRPSRAPNEPRSLAPAVESIDLRTRDGWSLRADVHSPSGPPVGVAVLAHALMARRTEFSRPVARGVAEFLVERGWRVVAFDFRGHGDSRAPSLGASAPGSPGPIAPGSPGPIASGSPGPSASGYDDLVADVATVCAFAREQCERDQPLVLVGHSLGGHAAMAAQGTGAARADAIVGIAAAPPFLAVHEPSRARWTIKRAAFASMLALARRVGRFPARALRLGSDDESLACCEDLERFARTGHWASRDGRVDYLEALARVRVPALHVVSTADRFECVAECGERFLAGSGGPRELLHVTSTDGGGPAPTHMGLVTSGRVRGLWSEVERWMRRVIPG